MTATASRGSPLTEGLILAAIPAFGYSYAFAYEVGYLSRFGVPYWAVEVSLAHTLVAAAIPLLAWLWIGFILTALPPGPYWGVLFQLLHIVPFGAVLWLFLKWFDPTSGLIVFLSVTGALLSATFLLIEIVRRLLRPLVVYDGPWLERWAKDAHRAAVTSKPDAHSAVLDVVTRAGFDMGRYGVGVWLLLFVFPFGYYGTGRFNATRQTEFAVVRREPPCALLRKYDDSFICAEFSRESGTLSGRIVHLSSSGDSTITFIRETIGPLSGPPRIVRVGRSR